MVKIVNGLYTMNKKIVVEEVGVCDFYEVGNWTEYYSDIRLGYKTFDHQTLYSDICFYIKDEDNIFGYFLSYNIVNIHLDDIIPIYSRKLVLYDFAIYAKAYIKLGIKLMDYAIKYAQKNGHKAIEIKVQDNYHTFFSFLKKHYKIHEFNNSYYIMIDSEINNSLQFDIIDDIAIEDLYYLYELNFEFFKNSLDCKLNEIESISIDRTTKIINFPSNVQERKDKVQLNHNTLDLIHLVYEMYQSKKIEKLYIDYSLDNPNAFEVYCNNVVYVNKDISTLKKDKQYILDLINKGIKYIHSYIINYDMNARSFSHYTTQFKCKDLIKK